MVAIVQTLNLAAYALGALGAALLFMEFFQLPSYVEYDPEFDDYSVTLSPNEVTQYTWAGRAGALLVALSFALQFLATLLA